jgi:acyl-CoA dehydrogenase
MEKQLEPNRIRETSTKVKVEKEFEALASPVAFLKQMLGRIPHEETLSDYASWWEAEGMPISDAVDRAGVPWLRMFDAFGERVDEILFPPEYWKMLRMGYQAGVVWRAFEEDSLITPYLLGYITCFHDPGAYCTYLVSLSTTVPLKKYGTPELQDRFLPQLLCRDERVWQGATWMTEAKGGSDLGATVETTARPEGDHWLLSGDKYFASNVGAELAIVAARPEGAPRTVQGLALFLVPRRRANGSLNYFIRRLKNKIGTRSVPTGEVELRDSEAFLLGKPEWGIYLILEALNLSRVGNSVGSVALAQRALADALAFSRRRMAFGRAIVEHPLLARQFEDRLSELKAAFALTWEAIQLLSEVWKETPRYSDGYHLFRLVAHLTKYWTAELAVQFAKWNMEVHGGAGVLGEYRAERWLREAMILPIWEGTARRQMLDGLEVMERKNAHRLLFQHLAPNADPQALEEIASRVEDHLALPGEEKEVKLESIFHDLASFSARTLLHKYE